MHPPPLYSHQTIRDHFTPATEPTATKVKASLTFQVSERAHCTIHNRKIIMRTIICTALFTKPIPQQKNFSNLNAASETQTLELYCQYGFIAHLLTYTALAGSGSPNLNPTPFCSLQWHSASTLGLECPSPMPWQGNHRGPMSALPCRPP